MRPWLCFLIFGAVIFPLLYRQGIMVTKSIAAVFFSFQAGKRGDMAVLNSCSGWVRHKGRFGKSGVYTFTLDCRLSKGDAAVSLLNQEKQELLRLDQHISAGSMERSMELHPKSRYHLYWEFQNATGTCKLHWECQPFQNNCC